MKTVVDQAIILRRINYGEADRILTLLTKEHGKVSCIAKGVRRPKSKLAGGLELLSVSSISYIEGRSELKTIVSTQLDTHFGNIVNDLPRTMLAYDFLKLIDARTEHECEETYFTVLESALEGLNSSDTNAHVTHAWFLACILQLSGTHMNIEKQVGGADYEEDATYAYDFDNMGFFAHPNGTFTPKHIKLLRLFSKVNAPSHLLHVAGAGELSEELMPLLRHGLQQV